MDGDEVCRRRKRSLAPGVCLSNLSRTSTRIVGRATGENWIGLIDATHAIVLSRLAIELSLIILNNLLAGQAHHFPPGDLIHVAAVIIMGHFAVFTIIYDIWAYHKALLADAIKLAHVCDHDGLTAVCQQPGFTFLLSCQPLCSGADPSCRQRCLPAKKLSGSCADGGFLLISLLCLSLAVVAAIEKRQEGQSVEKRQELHILSGTALSKSMLTIAVALIGDVLFVAPPFLILIIAISTYIPFNLFKVNPLNRSMQRR